MTYLQGQVLYTACTSGQGAIVIVEGETEQEDAFFYNRWFGSSGREVTFFAQNGWQRVQSAVAELQRQLPSHRRVFGITDRDFAPASPIPSQGSPASSGSIFRTPYYTVENYLLDPAGWLAVVRALERTTPPGWSSTAEIAAHIDAAYKQCMEVAAFNNTVRMESDRLPQNTIEYKRHPKSVRAGISLAQELQLWGQQRNTPEPLDDLFTNRLAYIQSLPSAQWPIWISGKIVLKVFLEGFPVKSIPHERLKTLYISQWPDPHPDLAAMVLSLI